MSSTYALIGISGLAVGAWIGWLISWWRGAKTVEHSRQLESDARELERRLHLQERENAKDVARVEKENSQHLKAERAAAFEEGRKLGQTEGHRDHIKEISERDAEFAERLRVECKRAADEAREQARMQFEQQQKLFSVKVHPYVEINDVGTYFRTKYEKRIGYQYQLLVNGIPAFQPHVITESTEIVMTTKDENINKVAQQALQAAQQVAQLAVDTYLGGAGTFVKLGQAIKRLPGTGQ